MAWDIQTSKVIPLKVAGLQGRFNPAGTRDAPTARGLEQREKTAHQESKRQDGVPAEERCGSEAE